MLDIPYRLKELLERGQNYNSFVLSSIANVSAWIVDNKTVFFPEYTDHSFVHLNEVIKSIDSLITDNSWPQLSEQDAAATIIAVLLHDCAMHLSEDGFYTLINGDYQLIQSRYIGSEMSWPDLWLEFMAEAKRFDSKKLISIFGDDKPVHEIPEEKIDLTYRHRLLIGEFIRRHHARLAHEIAFNGIPGTLPSCLKLSDEPDKGFLDLCGFIARSHNLSLRKAVDLLPESKKRVHLGTHVPYVMVLLRVADYIQIQSTRAPSKLLQVKSLLSPISKGEWQKHKAILEISHVNDDPEAIYVDAEPENAFVLESLIQLFNGFQDELDICWAVLGETYGRFVPLNDLGITIRRIKSSLDDLDIFIKEKSPSYIPKLLKFKTADAEIMELLIKPLYGDSPAIGIRELVQNSVDACIELNNLVLKGNAEQETITDNVLVTLIDDEHESRVEIEDYGIGMTLDIVQNYFLNIGASFRNCDWWRENHQTNGSSDINRTGRFGVGLLAAYLLGEELQIKTRHYSQKETEGLEFVCKKGDQAITVKNCCMHVGTKISIKIDSRVKNILLNKVNLWDWYALDAPKVVRSIFRKDQKVNILKQIVSVPNAGFPLSGTSWFRTLADGFNDVLWTYDEIKNRDSYNNKVFICNGIYIDHHYLSDYGEKDGKPNISSKLGIIKASTPSLVVFDQDGRLPLNLQRNELMADRLPFHEELSQDIAKYFAREMYRFCNNLELKIGLSESVVDKVLNFTVKGAEKPVNSTPKVSLFSIYGESLLPLDYSLFRKAKVVSMYVDPGSGKGGAYASEEFQKYCNNYVRVRHFTSSKADKNIWVRSFFEHKDHYRRDFFSELPIIGRRLLIRKTDIKSITGDGYVPRVFLAHLSKEWQNQEWILFGLGSLPKNPFNMEVLTNELNKVNSFGFIVYYFDWENIDDTSVSAFSKAWLELNHKEMFSKSMPFGSE